MADQTSFLPHLFDLEGGKYGESQEEIAVKESIRAIHERKPLEPHQAALVQTCLSLAKSMALGNQKGRAIANEATQLVAMLQALGADDDTPDQSELPPELQEILRGLATPPTRIGPAPVSNDAA